MNISALYDFPLTQLLRINFDSKDEAPFAYFSICIAVITLVFLISANYHIFKYRKEKNRYEAMFRDKDQLNTLVVQLMCKILQSDSNEIFKNKLAFIIKYIQQSFTGSQEKFTIEYLLSIYSTTNKDDYNTKIKESIRNLLNHKTWMQAFSREEVSAISDSKKKFSYTTTLSNVDIKEIAETLYYFLNEDQKKYLSYLLFYMANIGNNINKIESINLRTICVDQFMTPDQFSELMEAFDSQRQDQWFNKNLKEKDPQLYSDPEEIHNIFPKQENASGKLFNTNYEKTTISFIIPILLHCFYSIIITLCSNISTFAKLMEIIVMCALLVMTMAYSLSNSYSFSLSSKVYLKALKGIGCANILYMSNILFSYII